MVKVTPDCPAEKQPDQPSTLKAIEDTKYLLSVPSMRASIKTGMDMSPELLAKSLDW